MIVEGFVTVEDFVLSVTNWGDLQYNHLAKARDNISLKEWEMYVEFGLTRRYDIELKGRYAFKRDDIPEAAKKLKDYYDELFKEYLENSK